MTEFPAAASHRPAHLFGCQLGVLLRLCTRADHLARSKYQRSGLWLADAHDDSSKTLQYRAAEADALATEAVPQYSLSSPCDCADSD